MEYTGPDTASFRYAEDAWIADEAHAEAEAERNAPIFALERRLRAELTPVIQTMSELAELDATSGFDDAKALLCALQDIQCAAFTAPEPDDGIGFWVQKIIATEGAA